MAGQAWMPALTAVHLLALIDRPLPGLPCLPAPGSFLQGLGDGVQPADAGAATAAGS